MSLKTERGTDLSVYSRAFSPSVQRREQEGQHLVIHSFADKKPEGFSFTFQFQFPTGVCHTSLPFIKLFPSLYLRVQWGWKSTTEQSIKEGSWRVLFWWKSRELQWPSQQPWGKNFPALQFEWSQDTDICLWPVLTESVYILLFSLVASLSTTQKGISRLILLRDQEICLMIVIFAWGWMGEQMLASVCKAVSHM